MARHIFLNGIDIGNLRNEVLKNVTIKIAPNGDLYIVAEQYQAIEENSYVPVTNSVNSINPLNSYQSHTKLPASGGEPEVQQPENGIPAENGAPVKPGISANDKRFLLQKKNE